jgi:predicted Fe-Mo cluster-binding NifX family protein
MKIAITSLGETLDSPMDQRFGRARFFITFDTETKEWSAKENTQNLTALQGAGIQAGQVVVDSGAEAILTGHCGPKAFSTLNAGGIAVYTDCTGTVAEAISEFTAGRLTLAGRADVNSHSGSM